jgi:hypothetical protein
MVRFDKWWSADDKRLKIFVQVSDFGLRSIEPLFLISKPVAWGLTVVSDRTKLQIP